MEYITKLLIVFDEWVALIGTKHLALMLKSVSKKVNVKVVSLMFLDSVKSEGFAHKYALIFGLYIILH